MWAGWRSHSCAPIAWFWLGFRARWVKVRVTVIVTVMLKDEVTKLNLFDQDARSDRVNVT